VAQEELQPKNDSLRAERGRKKAGEKIKGEREAEEGNKT